MELPSYIEKVPEKIRGFVESPFTTKGNQKVCTVILSFFLEASPKKRIDILLDSGILKKENDAVNVAGYCTKYFSALTHVGAIRYNSSTKNLERADNFVDYLTYVITCYLKTPAKDKFLDILSTEQKLRFTSNPKEVVLELLQDKASVNTLRRIWRGSDEAVKDFILNT